LKLIGSASVPQEITLKNRVPCVIMIIMMMMMMMLIIVIREDMYTDRCGNTRRQKCRAKESGKKLKYRSLGTEIRVWSLKCTIIPVIIGATGICNKKLKENFGSYTRKTFDRFTTEDSYTWNITHNTESAET
jgi:hypothetical protein